MEQTIDKVELVNKLADEIVTKRKEQLRMNNKRWIPRNFYASNIGGCTRKMVHSILDWDKRELADDGLLALFESGKKEESNIIKMLLDLGYEVVQQQNPIQIKNRKGETICTGRIDGKIIYNGVAIPYEIKSMQDYSFQQLNSIKDFEKSPLHRRYINQLQLYMYGNEIEVGMFIISNFRQIKIIPVTLNYELCELIIQQLEKAWDYVQRKEYPEPISYDPRICDYCEFKILCTQTTVNKPAELIENKEMEGLLQRRAELEEAYKSYKQIDEQIKAPFKKNNVLHAFVGTRWEIIGKEQNKTTYNTQALDEDVLNSIKEEKKVTVYRIFDLDKRKIG